jgi:hypothetical protein
MPKLIFKNDSGQVQLHEDGIVHHEFFRRMVGKEFRDILEAGLTQLQNKQATKWLSDDRKNTVMEESDEKWAQGDWFPRAAKSGWKYWAIVNPEKAVGKMQMSRNAKVMEMGGIKVATFSTPDEALSWLRSVDLKKAG